MSGLHVAYLVILALCIVASGFFSGSETALVSIQRERVHQLAQRDRRGRSLEELLSDPDRMLSTLLVANNFVNILAASVATALFIDLFGETWGPWIVTLLLTGVILVVGEIGPKTLAHRYPEGFSLFVAVPISAFARVLGPISRSFVFITRLLFKLFRIDMDVVDNPVTEEDIRALADRPIREVMTPRVDMVTIGSPVTMEAVQEVVAVTGHSRFPVVVETQDEILGVLAVKDLLRMPGTPSNDDIARALRAPTYIPESRPVLDVLQEMRRGRFGFGVVVDEHGGVEGVVTTKDVIAELVGELQDEYDPGLPSVVPAGSNRWIVDGRLDVDELEHSLEVELPRGDYSTVAGLFMDEAGRIPDEGDAVRVDGITLTVLIMDRRRIARLRVER